MCQSVQGDVTREYSAEETAGGDDVGQRGDEGCAAKNALTP